MTSTHENMIMVHRPVKVYQVAGVRHLRMPNVMHVRAAGGLGATFLFVLPPFFPHARF